MFADAHLHLTDPNFSEYPDIADALLLFSCTATPSEWEPLLSISKIDERIVPFFGTHPWYSDRCDIEGLEKILRDNHHACVGEIGLDATRDTPVQNESFIEQLELASKYKRPVSLHIVKTEKETLEALRSVKTKAILHSFTSLSYIKPFTECDCYFSLSPRILSRSKEKIKTLIDNIPKDRLLVESDAPNCYSICMGMETFISHLSLLSNIDCEEFIAMTTNNSRRLIP